LNNSFNKINNKIKQELQENKISIWSSFLLLVNFATTNFKNSYVEFSLITNFVLFLKKKKHLDFFGIYILGKMKKNFFSAQYLL